MLTVAVMCNRELLAKRNKTTLFLCMYVWFAYPIIQPNAAQQSVVLGTADWAKTRENFAAKLRYTRFITRHPQQVIIGAYWLPLSDDYDKPNHTSPFRNVLFINIDRNVTYKSYLCDNLCCSYAKKKLQQRREVTYFQRPTSRERGADALRQPAGLRCLSYTLPLASETPLETTAVHPV